MWALRFVIICPGGDQIVGMAVILIASRSLHPQRKL